MEDTDTQQGSDLPARAQPKSLPVNVGDSRCRFRCGLEEEAGAAPPTGAVRSRSRFTSGARGLPRASPFEPFRKFHLRLDKKRGRLPGGRDKLSKKFEKINTTD